MNLSLNGGWYQRCGGFPSWNKPREGPGEVLWVGGLQCVHPRGRPLPDACVQSALPIANREGIRKLLFTDFMNLSPPLILPAVFSFSPLICLPAPTHSMAVILPLDKIISMLTRSEGGLWMCGRNYSLSLSSWPWLMPPWISQGLLSQRGGQIFVYLQNFLVMRRTYELVPEGSPGWPAELQRDWVYLLHSLISRLSKRRRSVG